MSLQVSVVSAEQEVWAGEAAQVSARTTEGEIGLRAGHTPLLGLLAEGRVRLSFASGDPIEIEADEGFLSLDRDVVQVVARHAQIV